jgi:uncharacterized protein
MMGSGLVTGVLIGFCFGAWRGRLGTARLAGAVGVLLGVPMAAIALFVQASQRPPAHFLLAFAAFTLMFCVAALVSLRSSLRWGLFMGSATLVGGGAAWGVPPSVDTLDLLVVLAGLGGVIFVIVAVIRAFLQIVEQASSGGHGPGASSSSAESARPYSPVASEAYSPGASWPASSDSWLASSSYDSSEASSSSYDSSEASSSSYDSSQSSSSDVSESSSSDSSSSGSSSSDSSWEGGGGDFGGGGGDSSW